MRYSFEGAVSGNVRFMQIFMEHPSHIIVNRQLYVSPAVVDVDAADVEPDDVCDTNTDSHPGQYICFFILRCVISSAEEGGYMVLSFCLFDCQHNYSKRNEQILIKLCGWVGHGPRTK